MKFVLLIWSMTYSIIAFSYEISIFSNIRLMGTDLVDEMIYSWTQHPPLPNKTSLILAEISAPVGLDERFRSTVENRLYKLLEENPQLETSLNYCSVCQQFVAYSNPEKTIMSRGIDQPQVIENLVKENRSNYGLSLHFEAVARSLVLRATIFEMQGPQKIVWARVYTTSMSSRRILRQAHPLISQHEARQQQLKILNQRDDMEVVTRFIIRQFNSSGSAVPSMIFAEQSFEAVPLPYKNTRMAFTIGFTSIADSMEGWSVGGHLARLMIRKRPHLFLPDFYWFFGGHHLRLRGPNAAIYGLGSIDLSSYNGEPKTSLTAWRLGFESHIKFRFGMMVFIENLPLLKSNSFISQSSFLGIPYHNFGMGVVVRW